MVDHCGNVPLYPCAYLHGIMHLDSLLPNFLLQGIRVSDNLYRRDHSLPYACSKKHHQAG